MSSKTLFLLMAEFEGRAAVKLEEALHYTNFKTLHEANKAANCGELPIPAFRMSKSQKSPYIIHLEDLAEALDTAREEAKQRALLLSGKAPISERTTKKQSLIKEGPLRRGRRTQREAISA
ncbi:pyocin activator PrtN family protein [Marinomonas sp. TW1]|uniref:pyocin activator PrtN family protein n=1 Tax=Marinomonas sp. TW1 TaxID=1561203 RepID=UPI0007AF9B67|nr:pyocin activator PrtN family protein [Marinomonas sp. TW1]